MKTTIWFKHGDLVPNDARYLKSERRYELTQEKSFFGKKEKRVWVDVHLYEVPLDEENTKKAEGA